MKTRFTFIALLFVVVIFGCSHQRNLVGTWSSSAQATLGKQIDDIIHQTDKDINIGVKIVSLDDDKVIYEKNSQRLFMPASTVKLFTLLAALHYLGPSYRFQTQVLTDEWVKGKGHIKNLYLKGSGDPNLRDYDLAELALELKQMGITDIEGQIYFDDTVFDDVLWSRGVMWDDRNHGYSAPVSGLNINDNRVVIKTLPAHHVSHKVHAIISPKTSLFPVEVKALTKEANASRFMSLVIEHPDHKKDAWPLETKEGLKPHDSIIVNGQTPLNADPHYTTLAVNDPSILAATYFKESLERVGITVHGHPVRKKTPEQARVLTKFQSRSLSEALIDFTKISNNVANDSLIKAIAASSGNIPASASAGLKLVNEFLAKEVGIPTGSLVTADGAGISRYNLVSPEHQIKLLMYAAKRFSLSAEFMAALPIAASDGTLSKRMKNLPLGSVRAKTGYMTGISCLAGFFANEEGKRFAFSILINGINGNPQKYMRLHEDIIAAVQNPNDSSVARLGRER